MLKIEKFWCAVRKQSLKSPVLGQTFFKNRKTSLFYIYAVLTLCKISKTSGAWILRYQHYGLMDGPMNERTNERMEEAEFIGPFRLKPWVQQGSHGFFVILLTTLCIINENGKIQLT